MHRVTCGRAALSANVPRSIRSFSTPPPRRPITKWGDVVIPSREEIYERKARHTDINYLKFENENSLAARLARPTIDITLARQQVEQKSGMQDEQVARKDAIQETQTTVAQKASPRGILAADELTATAKAEREVQPQNGLASTRTRETIPAREYTDGPIADIMVAKRREARLMREAMHRSLKTQQEEERLERKRREEERRMNKIANAHAAVQKSKPLEEQPEAPVKSAVAVLAERAANMLKISTELAKKRKQERLQRELKEATSSQNRYRDQSTSRFNRDSQRKQRKQESYEIESLEEPSSSSNGPEFKGPEPVSTNLLEVYRPAAEVYKTVARLQSGHIHGGDYSAYIPPSLASLATPPQELGAARLAELTLSHRRDVSLPSREYTLHLIASALKPKQIHKSS